MTKLAVLDIGTNSIHMVLAEVDADFSYKILDRFKNMARLGDGAFKNRRLSDSAMARGLEVLRQLTTLARNKGYDTVVAVATSAVREATNGGDFLEAVAQDTGLNVRVISGHEEARLIYLGVRHSIDLGDRPTLIVDVGGGSVELIVGNRTTMIHGQSLKLGAIRLKDLYLRDDPPTKAMIDRLERAVLAQLSPAVQRIRAKTFDRIIATSGMAGNIAEIIHLQGTGRPLAQVNLTAVTAKDLRSAEKRLGRATYKERLAIPGMDPKRADTLFPAVVVLRTLMDLVDAPTLTVSDKAIREGLIYDFIEQHREGLRVAQEIPNVRRRNVVSLARRCRSPETHTQHVAKLAVRLFDETQPLHGLGEREREWLEYAAVLHDVGYLINSRQHHKHAYYVIKHADLSGFTADEIELIANIARYHRRAVPRLGHASVKHLTSSQRSRLDMLSALLRIADGLDRSYFSVVQDVDVRLGRPVVISVQAAGDAELELWAARNRADLFEKVFKRAVRIELARLGEAS